MEVGEVIKKIRMNKNIPSNKVYKDVLSRPAAAKFEKGLSDTSVKKFLYILDTLNISLEEFEVIYKGAEDKDLKYTSNYINAYYEGSFDAPFLFLTVKNNEVYFKLMEHITDYLEKYNITIPQRNSFGFRNLSLETIQMNKVDNVLKIAPGKINGLRQQYLLQAVQSFDKKNI
ncbi:MULTISPECIES: hypothetical protein [Lysinibacillus]|uniref:hypothetical protein n=1 Tax=Lysinibacillus TaxID=400634 RepID=UPI00289E7E42|nr:MULTISPECIES: hypothetical protein [Lysinibacillus]MEA0565466.1 hypothetical protein [Lysinibacillus irui]